MTFDTKYLIRWGIPGWTSILVYLVTISWVYRESIFNNELDLAQYLGALISLGFIGIVIGYIMHQIYFSWNWLFSGQSKNINDNLIRLLNDGDKKSFFQSTYSAEGSNKHKLYYLIEFEWHKQLLLIDAEKREYITERYRYLLGTVHALGALSVSFTFSFLGVLLLTIVTGEWSILIGIWILLLLLLTIIAFKGFQYYSDNLLHFQGHFFNTLFEGGLK